jgi:hypothetical protein
LTGEIISGVTAKASSSEPNNPVSKIVDGSGLQSRDKDGLSVHSTNTKDMWLSAKGQVHGWVEFDFGTTRRLDGIDVWNYNEQDGTRRGIQKADISVCTAGNRWRKVSANFEFERAPAGGEYDDPTFIDMGGITTSKVRFDNIKNFDDVNYVGLSEVRFYEVVGKQAVRPVPADGSGCGDKKVTLAWMPGADARGHKVYLGADAGNLEFMGEKTGFGFMKANVSGLAKNTKYFWRVDEVGENGRVVTGKIWSFSSPGLVGWWKFDEENGATAHDSSGNGHDGILRGNCAWRNAAGKIGGAIELDGESGYVEIGSSDTFNFTDGITISCWVNAGEVKNEWAAIVTKGDNAWRLSAMRKQIIPHFSVNDPRLTIYLNGSKEASAGRWHHFAGVYDGQQLQIYIDGRPDAKMEWDGRIAANDCNVLIGENDQMRGRYWKGLIDDVRIYSYALSNNDIAAVYQGTEAQPLMVSKLTLTFEEPVKAAPRESPLVINKTGRSPVLIPVAIVAVVVTVVIIASKKIRK